jgi:hypothetical protein
MHARFLRRMALFAALLHVGDAGLTSATHCHGPGACGHAHLQPPHAHQGGQCNHAHARRQIGPSPTAPNPLAPDGRQHDCAACRHLGQPLDCAPLTAEQDGGDWFGAVVAAPPAATAPVHRWRYRSRAPPRLGASL